VNRGYAELHEVKEERGKKKIIICLVIKRDENFFLILFSEGYLGFNPGMFSAPAERPVLSRRRESVLSYSVVT
jgi:hypothetical protein